MALAGCEKVGDFNQERLIHGLKAGTSFASLVCVDHRLNIGERRSVVRLPFPLPRILIKIHLNIVAAKNDVCLSPDFILFHVKLVEKGLHLAPQFGRHDRVVADEGIMKIQKRKTKEFHLLGVQGGHFARSTCQDPSAIMVFYIPGLHWEECLEDRSDRSD